MGDGGSVGATKLGRPLDHSRDTAILDATLELIGELGYDRLTMEAVASRAQAGKATLYRRWPSKAALVLDAMRCRHVEVGELPDTGSLRSDLVEGLTLMATRLADGDGALVAGLLIAVRTDAELARLLGEQMIADKSASWHLWVDRAVERGQLTARPDADLLQEVVTAMFFGRLVLFRQPIDRDYITHVVDAVVMPLLDSPTLSTATERTPVS